MLRNANLVGDYAQRFAFNVLRVSVPRFSFEGGEEAPVQCLLVFLPISGGMAKVDTFYLEGRELTVRGTGQMDLVRNAYDLRLQPDLHRPGLVSVAATVKVVGPLDAPVFQPLPGSMFKSAVDGLWRNSLRPLKAIERLVRSSRSGDREEALGACDHVVRHRVEQLKTRHVEPIDLDEIVAKRVDRAESEIPRKDQGLPSEPARPR
jgi:hypothetical protein